ncbi:STAS domain-containing protein [Kitasatospora kifunensis]|uniref:STAS domain-containing protein n=1 Tax=Kitasatospora kifunensis TaxID=58351 RepID=UPI0016209E14|nr:STAS domain-containing protein [Kitasatospora kifunensis]
MAFCDSTSLNALLHSRLEAERIGARLELAALPAPVTRLFEITGADTVFTIHRTLDEALEP